MNYKYKTIDKEIIVSEKEHKKITEIQNSGKQVIYLRNGSLMINMAFVGYIKETEDATDEQITQQEEYLRLSPEKRSQTFTQKEFKPIIENTNWQKIGDNEKWNNCVRCGVSHFIPNESGVCLGCKGKKILVKI